MKQNDDIERLIQSFMDGQTTLDEEQRLAQYFRTHTVPAEWEPYRLMFAYFDEGMTDTLPPHPAARRRPLLRHMAAAVAVAAAIALTAIVVWPGRHNDATQPTGSRLTAALATDTARTATTDTALTDKPAATPPQPQRHSVKHKYSLPKPKSYYAAAQPTRRAPLLAVDSQYERAVSTQLQRDSLADELLMLRMQLAEQAQQLPIAMTAYEEEPEADEAELAY